MDTRSVEGWRKILDWLGVGSLIAFFAMTSCWMEERQDNLRYAASLRARFAPDTGGAASAEPEARRESEVGLYAKSHCTYANEFRHQRRTETVTFAIYVCAEGDMILQPISVTDNY